MPYGTILGVMTFMVLLRDRVKIQFDAPVPPPIRPQTD
jgi:hypothetical protein